ncbi:MAG: NAD(P)-binding domain-containing protein [Gammaproteobacteria bacterium]
MKLRVFDYVIVGAGPAGLQMGYFMQQAGWDYLVVEAGATPGQFFRTFPRHRKLISINKRHTGQDDPELKLRMDWNSLLSDRPDLRFTSYSGRYFPHADDYVRYLEHFARSQELNIRYGSRIERINKTDVFSLSDVNGDTYACHRLVIATGVPRCNLPDIPGIEFADTYFNASVDPDDYVDQRVLVIGKGNSAFETADNLIEKAAVVHVAGPHSIRFAWQTHYVGHLRAVNNNMLDTYQLKSQNAILDGHVLEIEKQGQRFSVLVSFVRANEAHKELVYDRVIACTGFRFDHSIFDETCKPLLAIDDRFPAQKSDWESANVSDMFFAGTLTQERDYKKSTSAFVHGFRYGARSLFRILAQRYHKSSWPVRALGVSPRSLMEAVIERVNRTSALWHQFGFFGDLITVAGDVAHYHDEVPAAYVHDSEWGERDNYFIVTLEYGPDHARVDPFDIEVGRVAQDDDERAFDAQYLHPVVRHFSRRKLVGVHHIAENLENEWTGLPHREPLVQFFERQLAADGSTAGACVEFLSAEPVQ